MLHYYEVVMATRMIKLGKTESAHKQNFKVFDTKRHKTLPKSVVTTLPTATFTSNHSTVKLSLIQVRLVCMCGSATSVKAPRQMKTKVIFHPAQTYISSLRNARLNYKILGQPLLSTHTPVKLTKPQSCRKVHSLIQCQDLLPKQCPAAMGLNHTNMFTNTIYLQKKYL